MHMLQIVHFISQLPLNIVMQPQIYLQLIQKSIVRQQCFIVTNWYLNETQLIRAFASGSHFTQVMVTEFMSDV